jgi:ACT domain-containing protein
MGWSMNKELAFITVIGKDQKGIVARISGLLFKNNINIEDISQKVMEGFFVMAMLVEISDCGKPQAKISAELDKLGKSMGLKIQIQHENIFKKMHRV